MVRSLWLARVLWLFLKSALSRVFLLSELEAWHVEESWEAYQYHFHYAFWFNLSGMSVCMVKSIRHPVNAFSQTTFTHVLQSWLFNYTFCIRHYLLDHSLSGRGNYVSLASLALFHLTLPSHHSPIITGPDPPPFLLSITITQVHSSRCIRHEALPICLPSNSQLNLFGADTDSETCIPFKTPRHLAHLQLQRPPHTRNALA